MLHYIENVFRVFSWFSDSFYLFEIQATTARKDRNNYYEAIKAHSAVVTCSLFAPVPHLLLEAVARAKEVQEATGGKELQGEVVVSGDFDGDIKIFINRKV